MKVAFAFLIILATLANCRKPDQSEKLIFRDGFSIGKDTTPPLVVSVTGEAGTNQLLVEFNEPVYTNSDGTGNLTAGDFGYQDNNATGAASLASMFEANGGDRLVVLTTNANLVATDSGDRVTFAANEIFDATGNSLAATGRIIIISAVPPTLIGAETMDVDRNGKLDHLKLTFNKNINDSSFPNYVDSNTLGGTTGAWMITAATGVRIDPTLAADIDNDNIVYIRWTEAGAEDTAFVPNLTTSASPGLQATNGATINQIVTNTIAETDAAPPVLLDATEKGGENQLVISFSEPVYTNNTASGNVTLTDFTYTNTNPGGATAMGSLVDADGSDNTITVQMNALFVMGDGATDRLAVNSNEIYDSSGLAAVNCLTGTHCADTHITVRITSGDAPVLLSAETLDINGNGKLDHYKLTFNVPVADASFPGFAGNNAEGTATTQWFIGNYANVRIDTRDALPPTGPGDTATNDTVIYLAFDEKTEVCSGNDISGCDTGALPQLTTSASPGLTDLDPTTIGQLAIGGITETDSALPKLITIKGSGGANSLFVFFSEAVFSNTAGMGNLTSADFSYQNDNPSGATGVSGLSEADGSDGKVTLTTTGNFVALDDNNDDLVVAAAAVFDLAGNNLITTSAIRVAPLLLSAETMDVDANGVIDHYKLTFASSVTDATFPGYGGVNAEGSATTNWQVALNTNVRIDTTNGRFSPEDIDNDNIIYLAFDGGSDTGERPDLTTSVTPGLALAGGLSDGLQIMTASLTELDKAPPKILSVFTTTISSSAIEVLFSESVFTNTGGSGNLVTGDFVYGNVNAGGAASISSMNEADGTDRKVRLTLNANVTFQDSSKDTVTAASIYDAADNLALTNSVAIRAFPRVATAGYVNASVEIGGVLYVGGNFSYAGYYSGSGLVLPGTPGYPQVMSKIVGTTNVAIPDGIGGFYIGGDFTHVGGQARTRLARIKADGTVYPWNPGADGAVTALALSGNTLYVGGDFLNVGGQARNRLAAVDTMTGLATTWNPNASANVAVIQVAGGIIYVGGNFTNMNGTTRNRLAAFDQTSGTLTSWNPNVSSQVYAIIVTGSTVYFAGSFSSVGGTPRQNVAAIDTAGTLMATFNPSVNDTVRAMAYSGTNLYIGGNFDQVNGSTRTNVAELDPTTGSPSNWDPVIGGGSIYSMALSGNTLYISGTFDTVNGNVRERIASLSTLSDTGSGIAPNVNSIANTIAVSGSNVFFGGNFNLTGVQTRGHLAAIDLATNTITAWNPNAGSTINAMVTDGTTIFVGGSFTTIGGNAYTRAARIATNGFVSGCGNPDLTVNAMAVADGFLYLGGSFNTVSGVTRYGLSKHSASVCTNQGTWNPSSAAANSVSALAVSGSTLYVAGSFSSLGGQSRNRIAALNVSDGLAQTWNPGVDGTVSTLLLSGTTLYTAGTFTTIGGQARANIAALDTASNTALAWNPSANGSVSSIALAGTTLYAGGNFTNIGGQMRNYFAALDTTSDTNNANSMNPNPNAAVDNIHVSGSTIFLGGNFTAVGNAGARSPANIDAATGNLLEY